MSNTDFPIQHPSLTAYLRQTLRQARVERVPLSHVPEIELYLINADFPTTALTADEMRAVLQEPAYWAFCWASGQVMARYLLDHPEWVRGRRVVDFGCGSGVVAIAAAMAGAGEVIACDLDPAALQATVANAELNEVCLTLLEDFDQLEREVDLILVADVLYDRENLPWLERFLAAAPQVLVADSRVKSFHFPGYRYLGCQNSSTWPDLDEFDEFRQVRLYAGRREWKNDEQE